MMTTTLTRQALYDLVWSRPRTALAKELGISDVAIGKHCARANVPAPPPGYWARLSAGSNPRRTPLPIRLPGQSDAVLGQDDRRFWQASENLDEPVSPPVFVEDPALQVSEAAKRIGKVVATRDLNTPDPALSRVLAAEGRRRAKHEDMAWSFYKPYFETPMYQRQFRIFNSLARALAPLYGKQEVRCDDRWTQGVGTEHFLVLHLSFGGVTMNLNFLEPSDRRERGQKAVSVTTLRVGTEKARDGVQEWVDTSERKLEAQLTEITGQLLLRAEMTLRAEAQFRHELRLERREELRVAIAAQKREEEKKRLAAIEDNKKKVRDEVIEIARRRTVAEEIRATIEALRAHPEVLAGGHQRFEAWAEHALLVAASLDPMNVPLDDILGSFNGAGAGPAKSTLN